MIAQQPPKIDARSYARIIADIERLVERFTAIEVVPVQSLADKISQIKNMPDVKGKVWQRTGSKDAASALIGVAGRMAELVIERLNRVPEKNFLAFLGLIGPEMRPPQPARVPLTFQLAAGTRSDTLVPARTLVASTLAEGETAPVIFETERELVVTASQLAKLYTHEPDRDSYSDHSQTIAAGQAEPFAVFQGHELIPHDIYLGHQRLYGMDVEKTIILQIEGAQDFGWLHAVTWEYRGGALWRAAAPPAVASSAA